VDKKAWIAKQQAKPSRRQNQHKLQIKTEKFDISIDNKIDLDYANKIANDVSNLNSSDKFRKFII
jgi:hypothetical protein